MARATVHIEALGISVTRRGRRIRFSGIDAEAEAVAHGLGDTGPLSSLVAGVQSAKAAGHLRSRKLFLDVMGRVASVLAIPHILDAERRSSARAQISSLLDAGLLESPEGPVGAALVLKSFSTGALSGAVDDPRAGIPIQWWERNVVTRVPINACGVAVSAVSATLRYW